MNDTQADIQHEPHYLTTAEAASRMRLSIETVRRMCVDGLLTGAYREKSAGPWRIPETTVENWVRKNQQGETRKSAIGRVAKVAGPLALIVTILGTVSIIADFGGAQQQLRKWGKQLGIVHDFAPAKDGETLIVIASFYHTEGVADTNVQNEIRRAIEKACDEEGFPDVRIGVEATRLEADNRTGAEALGNRYNASMVIWGEDTGVRMIVNFQNLRDPDATRSRTTINETDTAQLVNPQAYQQFVVDYLPAQLTVVALTALGQSYLADGEYSESLKALEKALAVSLAAEGKPVEVAEHYFYLGWMRQAFAADPTGAIRNYSEAIRLNPRHIGAYVNRGIVRRSVGDLSGAMDDYDIALRLSPGDTLALYNRGNAKSAMGDIVGALADYDMVIVADPQRIAAYVARGNAKLQQGEVFAAISDYDRAIGLNDDDPSAYFRRGLARLRLGNLPSAAADFTEVIRLAPGSAEAYGNLGLIKFRQGDYAGAIIDFDDAIRLNPSLAISYSGRGVARYAAGYTADALADYDKALQIDPNLVEAMNNRAILRRDQGDISAALSDLDQAIRLKPEYPEAYANRGTTRFIQGDFAGAIADFRRYLVLHPDAPERSALEAMIAEAESKSSHQP